MQEHEITSKELPWILFLSGMDGRTWGIEKASERWSEWYGGKQEYLGLEWQKKDYQTLVGETIEVIDDLYKSYAPGLMVCTSASVCMGIRMIAEKEQQLMGMVAVDGFVRFEGREQKLKCAMSKRHRDGFFPGVNYAEAEVLPNLTDEQLKRLVVVSSSNDGAVSLENSRVSGALLNYDTGYRFHSLAIYRAISGGVVEVGVRMLAERWSRSK